MTTVPYPLDHVLDVELEVSRTTRLLIDLDRYAARVRGLDPRAPRLARIDRRLDELRALVAAYSNR